MEFTWAARYRDNTFITQKDNKPFDQIPRKNLWLFQMFAPNGKKIFTVEFKPGMYVFYRRRAAMIPGKGGIEAVHLIGYRYPDSKDNVITFFYESDWRLEISDFRNPKERLADIKEYKHEIQILPEERTIIEWE